jgi:hypothetical protein
MPAAPQATRLVFSRKLSYIRYIEFGRSIGPRDPSRLLTSPKFRYHRPDFGPVKQKQMWKGIFHGNWYGQVVQRHQGLRLHSA